MLIDGGATCGYREYAKNYGHIVYMTPQQTKQPWEHSIPNPKDVVDFIAQYPDSVIWSLKHDPRKNTEILAKINNKKVYYSCTGTRMYNSYCDVSLVDTEERIERNAKLWFKGKDPNYWKPSSRKEFDYLLIGRRADKNELYFLDRLNETKEKRSVLWIGGANYKGIIKTNYEVGYTDFANQDSVRNLIPLAKVGILFTEIPTEGFPQSFLEMTMCGLPVVYNENAPRNKFYFHESNSYLCSKEDIIRGAETLLKNVDAVKCRETAIENYSLDKSYERILSCTK